MIKILFISTGLGTGGAEMMLYKLLSRIDRTKFDPYVISLMGKDSFGDRIMALDIPVHTLEIARGKLSLQKFTKLISLVRQEQPDIIQGWMYHASFAAQLAQFLAFKSIPVLWNIRHSLYSLDYEKKGTAAIIRLLNKISNFPSKIIYNSQTSATQHQKLGYKSHKTVVVPNGFDINLFQPSSDNRLSLRKELGLAEETFLIGRICRYHPMKDHDSFLRAAALLLQNFPQLHFVLVGTEVDGNNYQLSKLINTLNIGDKLHLLGERQDISRLTSALDIATSSSYFGEAFPNIIGEAMACEVPCVATDVGDSAAIIGETGKIVPPKNPQALADSCQELILLGAEGRKALGAKARQKVIKHYSLDAIVAQYQRLYINTLND
ncbi:glycosyltransferase [Xenococcus sp. PCC 7305]|uniref:glycosyltransferase family 4 protein n=1 Tax=Xenococcus sp. PCC 7305 TaxID=102125 RepID=UPI0002AC5EAE|nr:glycosyltransferase [Xenococcus sp. PCC 7305]ELS03860.1 glycosyltransferase [Xenococcus sp. PCC 7305]